MAETIWRKLMASILALALALSYIPAGPLTTEAADVSTSLSGSSIVGSPSEIASAADLAYMRDQFNIGDRLTPREG